MRYGLFRPPLDEPLVFINSALRLAERIEEIRQQTDILDIIRTWRFLEETKQIEVD